MSRSERSDDDTIAAAQVDIEEIPVIDFAPFLSGDAEARREVAEEIAWACRVIGFFYLKGHGVPEPLLDDIFARTRDFHLLPRDVKRQSLATRDWYRGWVPAPENQDLTRNTRMFDQYRLQLDWPPENRLDDPLARIFDVPNRWPEGQPAFEAATKDYLRAMTGLTHELLHAFALGLDLPEDRFDDYFHRPPSQLSLLYYPPLPPVAQAEVSNIVSHTDEGPFTILAQDEIGGLEVKRRDGAWIAAPPMPGTFVINVGDSMMWWSNGEFISNYHRVKNRSGQERFSIPFFVNPDRDVVVSPLPEIVARTGPARYEPVKLSEHLARFYDKLDKDPHEQYG
jgi:isopenicillin N synthase-like dioxygenase